MAWGIGFSGRGYLVTHPRTSEHIHAQCSILCISGCTRALAPSVPSWAVQTLTPTLWRDTWKYMGPLEERDGALPGHFTAA